MSGRGSCVYLIGSGPGDPGLLTCRGRDLLLRADALVFDYLADPGVVALAPQTCERVYVGKKGFERHVTQDEINQILVDVAQRLGGKPGEKPAVVVRLKGGDPFVFGRGGEEALALRAAGIAFEVVPGVTSGIAAPAYAGIPVTHRGISTSVTLVTGNEDPTKECSSVAWAPLAGLVSSGGTLCFYMGMRNLGAIATHLVEQGADADTPVALVRWGATTRQQTLVGTLADIAARAEDAGFTAPVMTVVGHVAALYDQLAWFETRPLLGRTIVVTRSRSQASDLAGRLADLGAEVLECPTIEFGEPEDLGPLDESLRHIGAYGWVVFTSVNGVDAFFERLAASPADGPRDARALASARVVAIGPATARRLEDHGIRPDVLPERFVAESVFDAMAAAGVRAGDRVLIPRAQEARETLPELLRGIGATVDVAPAYRTHAPLAGVDPRVLEALRSHAVDGVTFTSSSTAKNLVGLLGDDANDLLGHVERFSIGPVTSATLADLGIPATREAPAYTIPGLVTCILNTYVQGEEH